MLSFQLIQKEQNYEAPRVEVIEIESQSVLCASPDNTNSNSGGKESGRIQIH